MYSPASVEFLHCSIDVSLHEIRANHFGSLHPCKTTVSHGQKYGHAPNLDWSCPFTAAPAVEAATSGAQDGPGSIIAERAIRMETAKSGVI
jgi:hypothetical protein